LAAWWFIDRHEGSVRDLKYNELGRKFGNKMGNANWGFSGPDKMEEDIENWIVDNLVERKR